MTILLIGYRGSGKTSVGRKLADRLWYSFLDTDEMIVARAGKTIREIFEQDGEGAFRDLESQVLVECLGKEDHVISLGGGAVLREVNREAIKRIGCRVIYLKADPKVLFERIQRDTGTAANRPALTKLGGSIDEVEQLVAQREPLYREVATGELDVSNLSVEDAVVYIARLL
jgi:shikimate kinase